MDFIQNFVVIEGGDGSGTTTQLALLAERMKAYKKPVFFPTFEPTEGHIGKVIRAALKKEIDITPETLAYLFAADRNEHLYGTDGILEHIDRGELVVSDRYALSSLVYQGIECSNQRLSNQRFSNQRLSNQRFDDELPALLNSRFPAPEMTIFMDLEPEIAISRIKGRSSREIYEYREFQEKVREKYRSLLEKYRDNGAKVVIIDASKSVQEVSDQLWSAVSQMPIFKVQ